MGRTAAFAAVTALTFALAGCTGSSDEKSDASDAPTTAAVVDTTDSASPEATTEPTADAEEGSEGEAPGAGGAVCELLDAETIETITGLPFTTVEPTGDVAGDEQTTCEWSLEGDNIAIVQVLVLDSQGATLDMQRTAAESMFDDVADVEVAGVDDAFTYMGGFVVAMTDGDDFVQVMYMSAFEADTAPLSIQLAETVIANR